MKKEADTSKSRTAGSVGALIEASVSPPPSVGLPPEAASQGKAPAGHAGSSKDDAYAARVPTAPGPPRSLVAPRTEVVLGTSARGVTSLVCRLAPGNVDPAAPEARNVV